MKQIVFYQISDKFKSVFTKDSLKVFLEIERRSSECDNVKNQFALFIEKMVPESILNLMHDRFGSKDEFKNEKENHFKINNPITKDEENLYIFPDRLELDYQGKHSQFLDFISLYFPGMVAINQKTNEIVALENLTNLSLI